MQTQSLTRKLFPKTIAISLSPNTTSQDTLLALKLICSPGKWQTGERIEELERQVAAYIGTDYAFSLDSGRSSLYLTLKAMGIGPGDEVLLQAYTCVAVPNAVVWCGATPRYVDIDPVTLNMDPEDLQAKISSKPRAIIVQHTFGRPAPMDEICSIARQRGVRVIEDCAHAIGATYQSKRVGCFGDAAIFSFGRDKVISSVSGGMVVINDPALAMNLTAIHDQLPFPSASWIFQQLFHPIAFAGILSWYDVMKVGKTALVGFQKMGLLSRAVVKEELGGCMPPSMPTRMPAAVASMALSQFSRLEDFNQNRQRLAGIYTESIANLGIGLPSGDNKETESIFLRYTIQVPDPEGLHQAAKAQHIYLGNWYDSVISPKQTDLEAVNYKLGVCPVAEKTATTSVNLPTHPKVQLSEARTIAALVNETMKTMNKNGNYSGIPHVQGGVPKI